MKNVTSRILWYMWFSNKLSKIFIDITYFVTETYKDARMFTIIMKLETIFRRCSCSYKHFFENNFHKKTSKFGIEVFIDIWLLRVGDLDYSKRRK